MNARKPLAALLAIGLLASGPLTTAAVAAPTDLELLKSYVGDWRGRGTIDRQGETESVVCKLNVESNGVTKVVLDGACSLAGGKLVLRGTMAYVAEKKRYEAIVSSNTEYAGQAIGRRKSNGIVFNLQEIDASTSGKRDISLGLALSENVIDVDFSVTDKATGRTTRAKVPLSK